MPQGFVTLGPLIFTLYSMPTYTVVKSLLLYFGFVYNYANAYMLFLFKLDAVPSPLAMQFLVMSC